MSRKTATQGRQVSGRFDRAAEVTPLPGMRGDNSGGWIEATVMPRESTAPPPTPGARSRVALYEAGCTESAQFRADVLRFLQAHRLLGSVRWISEPGSLPMVTLHCQPRVLEQLQREPQFEAGCSMPLEVYT
jgi:hypothetical protein